MTDQERKEFRIALAKDVLETIDNRHIVIMTYCSGVYTQTSTNWQKQDARIILHDMERCCNVCALGSLFLSYIKLFDNVKIGEIARYDYIHASANFINDKLSTYFTENELHEIEGAFECFTGRDQWLRHYPESKIRLKQIMLNILRNDGEFVLVDIPANDSA